MAPPPTSFFKKEKKRKNLYQNAVARRFLIKINKQVITNAVCKGRLALIVFPQFAKRYCGHMGFQRDKCPFGGGLEAEPPKLFSLNIQSGFLQLFQFFWAHGLQVVFKMQAEIGFRFREIGRVQTGVPVY